MTNTARKYAPSPKQIEARSLLIERSEIVEEMINLNDPRLEGVDTSTKNNAIIAIYYPSGKFNTYKGWLSEGYQVKKGSEGYKVWSKPIKGKKTEDDGKGDTLERKYKFFAVANIFHESQVQLVDGSPDKNEEPETSNKAAARSSLSVVKNKLPTKLRAMASTMQKQIDNKLAARETNTARRLAHAEHARLDGQKLQRAQMLMRNMADLIDRGCLPVELAGISKKADILDLMTTKKEPVNNGYHTFYNCTGEPLRSDPATVVAFSLIDLKDTKPEDELRAKIAQLNLEKIEGYHSTPSKLVDRVINDYADISVNHSVFEPEAGSGSFLDGLDRVGHKGIRVAIEKNASLCAILRLKGYDVEPSSFLDFDNYNFLFDRILMNPPFERQQDIDHITHAIKFLAEGGLLAAICSESVLFRNNKKTTQFRALLENYTYEFISLESGEFKESGTMVKTQLLVLNN